MDLIRSQISIPQPAFVRILSELQHECREVAMFPLERQSMSHSHLFPSDGDQMIEVPRGCDPFEIPGCLVAMTRDFAKCQPKSFPPAPPRSNGWSNLSRSPRDTPDSGISISGRASTMGFPGCPPTSARVSSPKRNAPKPFSDATAHAPWKSSCRRSHGGLTGKVGWRCDRRFGVTTSLL